MLSVEASLGFQAAPEGSAATLTLGGWGVVVLAFLLIAAASGWILFAASRAWRRPPDAAGGGEELPDRPPPDALEQAFEAAVQSRASGAILCRDGRVVRAAGEPSGPLGPDAALLVGLPVAALARAEDVLILSEALRRLVADSESSLEIRVGLDPAGGGGSRHVTARMIRPPGTPAGSAVLILSDISAPAAVAEAATRIAARVESALSFHPDGILVTVPERGEERVLLVNRAMESMLGIRASGLLGRPLAELRGRLEERFPAGSAERLLGDARCDTTETFEAPGDPPTVIQRTSRPLGDPGFHGGRLVSFRDLTAEKTRVEELRRAAEEAEGARASLEKHHEQILMANEGLEKRISDLGRFNREMRTLDEMKSNLLANVSHELQTPLVSIRGYTEMILKGRLGPLTEEQERGLQVALRNVDRLIALLDGLLSFVRTERESAPLRIEVFPLKPLVEEVLTLLRTSAEEKAVNVTAQFPSGDLSIKADRARISQVFINLLTNAIKYNRGGGSVAVEATRGHRATARVEIRDTGVGIPREDLDRVFERFYRGERGKGRGSGLGLAITKDILRMHGCMIRADSEPGKGSTFSFTLPLEFRGRAERSARVTPDRQDG